MHVLKRLLRANHRVAGVLTELEPEQRETATVATLARRTGVRLLPSRLVRDTEFADWIAQERVDVLLNVHSLHIASADVVRAPRIGSFNLHPGPLPRYAGLNAPSWAIYHGETSYGVTLHWMDAEIDTGPIAYQSLFKIGVSDTGLSVSTRCVRLGLSLVDELLAAAALDPRAIPARVQDPTARTYVSGAPDDHELDWARPARLIERLVRASDYFPLESPWGYPSTHVGTKMVGLVRVALTGERCEREPGTLRRDEQGAIDVATGDEWLRLIVLEADGRRVEPAKALRGVDLLQEG